MHWTGKSFTSVPFSRAGASAGFAVSDSSMSSATCAQPVAVVIGFPIHGALGVVGAWRVWWCSVVHVQSTLSGCELDISATSAVVGDKISFDASEESASGGAPGAIGLVCFLPRPMVGCAGFNCARHAHVRM